ncbi:MAG: hypothetical protein HC936_04715 [Leptolyngbyaceae cyanobacterium SU_3_3]|nr:hypothetical protein [Leptolyngbyaceae cyanobacterium SU_3_3]NJR49093.1 hypothetical protein [Leptolyngbyaceae cyanobacterium CSU_1_3]
MGFLGQKWQAVAGVASLVAVLSFGTPASAAPTEPLTGGRTSVQLSADFVNALVSLQVAPGVVGRGTLDKGVASFPISGGAIDLGTVKAEIIHRGGLSLKAGNTTVELTDFIISTLGEKPVLTGLVTVNDSLAFRAPLFNLGITGVTPPLAPKDDRLVLSGVEVTLTAEAAGALNQVFGVTAFKEGLPIGTARVRAGVATH